MKKTVLTSAFSLLFFLMVNSQSLLPLSGYFHLTGYINSGNQAILELVKLGDSVYADFQDLSGNPMIQPRRAELAGKMGKDGNFRLEELFNEKGATLTGKSDGEMNITGTWKTPAGRSFPVTFSEKYPAGTVQLNLFATNESKKLVNKAHTPSARIDLAVLMPAESGNSVVSDSLATIIRQCFFGVSNSDSTTESLVHSMKSDFFDNYFSTNEEMYKEMPEGMSYNWEMLKFMHIMINNDHLLTFYITSYGFSGGAHGLETDQYYSVNLKTGKIIQMQDIIRPGTEEILSGLLTGKLKKMAGLAPDSRLTDSGYFTDTIKPGSNFYLTPDGIGFYYNQYDIAPYAFGSTNIFLDFNELKGVMR